MAYSFIIVSDARIHSRLADKRRKFFTVLHENEVTILATQIFWISHEKHLTTTERLSLLFTLL